MFGNFPNVLISHYKRITVAVSGTTYSDPLLFTSQSIVGIAAF